MNDQTLSFEYIYDIFTITDADLRIHAKTFAELYNVDLNDFIVELLLFRGRYNTKTFGHFSDFAKFVLTSLSNADFSLLQFFVAVILILPFATADCERSSAMNRIKSPERNKLRDILMDLLLLYDITPEEKAKLDINKLAYDIIHNVWKYEKKNLLDPKLQQNVNQMYSMIFFYLITFCS